MRITVELPDDIVRHADAAREALEALAIQGYQAETLTHAEAAHLLGLSRYEFDALLKERGVWDHAYSIEDLQQDIRTLEELRQKGILPARQECSSSRTRPR